MDAHVLRTKANLLKRVRQFFESKNVLEVNTPCIVPHPVSDPNIDSIQLQTQAPAYLRTSPESTHKWLLAHQLGDIFELGPVFRAGELGRHHEPEFLMLEWYRCGYDWRGLADEVIELIHFMSEGYHAAWTTRFCSWEDTLEEHLGLTLQQTKLEHLQSKLPPELSQDPRVLTWSREALLDYLYATEVQSQFDPNTLTVVYDYPADQSALAQLNPDGLTAKRFEVFLGSIEVGNGYQELTDYQEQKRRFEDDQKKRLESERPIASMDERLLEALALGLPACSGVALGVERIIMAILQLDKVSDAMTVSAAHPFSEHTKP